MSTKSYQEAEATFLGLALTDPLVVDEYAGTLSDADFWRPPHANLWRRLVAMREDPQHARAEGEAWTSAVLIEAFSWGQEVDGGAHVVQLSTRTPGTSGAAGYYVRVMQSAALGRAVKMAATVAIEKVDAGEPPDQVLAGYESAMAALSLRASVQVSPWVPIGETAAQVYGETQEAQRNPESRIRRVVPSPWPKLNYLTRGGFRRGEVAILAGRPGTGKTAGAMQIAEWAAQYGGVGVYSMEMTRHALVTRELARMGQVDLTAITTARLNAEHWRGMTRGVEILDRTPIWVDDTPAQHVTQLRARAKRLRDLATRSGVELRFLVIDYAQLATATVAKGENENTVLARISMSLVAIAKELDVAILALSQMNRDVEKRTGERPKNSDLRGSGQWEQDSAIIMFTYADPDSEIEDAREIIVTKARHGEIGDIAMRWSGQQQSFFEVDPMHEERPRPRVVEEPWYGGE